MCFKFLGLVGLLSFKIFASSEGVGEFISNECLGESTSEHLSGSYGYYDMRLEALPEVSVLPESPAKAEFLKTIDRSKRVFNPLLTRYEISNIFYQTYRGLYTGNSPVSAAAAAALNGDEILEGFVAFCNRTFPSRPDLKDAFLANIERLKALRLDKLEEASGLGVYRTSTLRNFLNKQILGLTGRPTLEGSEELFQGLKSIDFLRTSIPSTVGYRYSQRIAAREFLEWYAEISSLILGCGSFLQRDLGALVFRREEGGCGCCHRQHHVSKREMTVSLMDNLDYSEDSYNEEGAGSDVVGDVMSRAFWQGVVEGLGGRRLPLIEDHSYSRLLHGGNIDLVLQTLAEDGEFKVWDESLKSSAEYLSPFVSYYTNLGFKFKGLDGEYAVFGK